MGRIIFLGLALATALANGAMAQGLDPVRVEMFRSILVGNECTLTEAAAGNILPRFDFTKTETRAIVGALVASGEVELDGNTLMLVDGSCDAPDPVVALLDRSDVQQFIAVMAENGCAMTEAEGETVFTARGVTKAQVGAVVGPMIQAGMATFANGTLSVDAAFCTPPVVAEAPDSVVGSPVEMANVPELDRSGMFGMSRVRQLVDVMAAHSCTLNMDTPDAFLAEAGIDHGFATFVARKMIADGYASMVSDSLMQLPPPYCISADSPAPAKPADADILAMDGLAGMDDTTGMDSLAGVDDTAAGVDMAMVASLRNIFLANGCRLAESDMDRLLPPAGFTKSNIKPIFGYLEDNGELVEDEGSLVLQNDACVAAPAEVATTPPPAEMDRSGMFGMSQVRQLVDVMAQNGCTLNMETPDAYLAEAGIDHGFATFIAKKMLSDGFASMVDGQNMLLPAPYCIAAGGAAPVVPDATPDAAPDEPAASVTVPRMQGMSDEAMKVVAVFNDVGCEIPVSGANDVFTAAGLTMAEGMAGLQPFIVNGQVRVSESGAAFVMDSAICDPARAGSQADDGTQAPVADTPETDTPPDTPRVEAMTFENDGSPQARFFAAVIANGCALEISGAESYLADAADLRMDQAYRIVNDLVNEGRATLVSDNSTVQIDRGYCTEAAAAAALEQAPPETPVAVETPETATVPTDTPPDSTDPRAGVLAMLAANGCQVTQANVAGLAEAAGLDLNTTMQILGAMMNAGEATSPDFGQTLQVGPPLCMAAAAAAPKPTTPREIFINLIKQNNCSITAAEFGTMLPVEGLDASTAFGLINELEAEGVISLPATRDVVTLSAEMCR